MIDTRERIVQASAELFWRQGFPGTGMKKIAADAKAPFGSVYHFFPGGKEELGVAAIRWSGGQYGDLVDAVLTAALVGGASLAEVLPSVFAAAGDTVRGSGYADACPIATVALEMASSSEVIRVACAEVFESWLVRLDQRFHETGVVAERCRDLSTTFLMLLEGAFLLARTTRSTAAFAPAGTTMALALRAALAG